MNNHIDPSINKRNVVRQESNDLHMQFTWLAIVFGLSLAAIGLMYSRDQIGGVTTFLMCWAAVAAMMILARKTIVAFFEDTARLQRIERAVSAPWSETGAQSLDLRSMHQWPNPYNVVHSDQAVVRLSDIAPHNLANMLARLGNRLGWESGTYKVAGAQFAEAALRSKKHTGADLKNFVRLLDGDQNSTNLIVPKFLVILHTFGLSLETVEISIDKQEDEVLNDQRYDVSVQRKHYQLVDMKLRSVNNSVISVSGTYVIDPA